jgi:hypothetical protein
MTLTEYHVDRGQDEFDGAVAIRCLDCKMPVLVLVGRDGLDDYFGWPWTLADKRGPTIEERRLVVDRHIEDFQVLIQGMYSRGEHEPLDRFGSTIRLIRIDHISKAEITLTDSVIQISRGSKFG